MKVACPPLRRRLHLARLLRWWLRAAPLVDQWGIGIVGFGNVRGACVAHSPRILHRANVGETVVAGLGAEVVQHVGDGLARVEAPAR